MTIATTIIFRSVDQNNEEICVIVKKLGLVFRLITNKMKEMLS